MPCVYEALDDRQLPVAEVCRRVNRVVERERAPRISYVHFRRLVHEHRAREDARRARRAALLKMAAVYSDASAGRRIDAYEVAERVAQAGR